MLIYSIHEIKYSWYLQRKSKFAAEKNKIAQAEKDTEVELARIAAEKDKIVQGEKDRELS